ncbi:MAG: hypothetical protein K2O04_05765 [Clostridiales bacterium]|nr:hypothetical protein [Clostridiales bacterium]
MDEFFIPIAEHTIADIPNIRETINSIEDAANPIIQNNTLTIAKTKPTRPTALGVCLFPLSLYVSSTGALSSPT